MHSADRVDVKMRMGILGEGSGAGVGVTPLIFQSAVRRAMPVEPETIFNPRAQEEAEVIEGLRGQVKALQAKVEMVRNEARADGRAEGASGFAASLERERSSIALACAAFNADRERYFSEVEGEVVRLALAIAARVLHREARMDPLLLAASVRVALEKIDGQRGTSLRVPSASASAWRALFPDAAVAEVIGDDELAEGDVVLESQVGRVELGVPVQLEEIEKGFFDLLRKRPA